jgi:hypothetical protein
MRRDILHERMLLQMLLKSRYLKIKKTSYVKNMSYKLFLDDEISFIITKYNKFPNSKYCNNNPMVIGSSPILCLKAPVAQSVERWNNFIGNGKNR